MQLQKAIDKCVRVHEMIAEANLPQQSKQRLFRRVGDISERLLNQTWGLKND